MIIILFVHLCLAGCQLSNIHYNILDLMYGVTLLALGNGAPDIFSSYAAIDQNDDRDASLAFGALFGK